MKIFLCLLSIPYMLCGICEDCNFPYKDYLYIHSDHYSHTSYFLAGKNISIEHLRNSRERAIFYAGCAFSLDNILKIEEEYQATRYPEKEPLADTLTVLVDPLTVTVTVAVSPAVMFASCENDSFRAVAVTPPGLMIIPE